MFDKNYVFSLMTRAKGCPFETQKITLTCSLCVVFYILIHAYYTVKIIISEPEL